MAVIVNAKFNTDLDSFSGGVRVTTKGSAAIADAAGALQVGAGVTANRDFANITSGKSRIDFSYKVEDSSIAASSTTLMYAMENGVAPASGSSLCTIGLSRFDSSSGSLLKITYRNNAGVFVSIPSNGGDFEIRRGAWWIKIGIVLDHTAKTFDLYIEDVLFVKSAPWPNAAAVGFGRISFVGQAAAPDTWFDDILVQDSWDEGESVLVDHNFVGGSGEIENSTPQTSLRGLNPQPWMIAPDTANVGAFSLSANGAVADANKACMALIRCGVNGILEAEFRTSVAGARYFGMVFRFWDYPSATGAGAGVFRVSSSDNKANLIIPDRTGAQTVVQSVNFSPTADTVYTLKLEMRGRVLIGSIKAAAMDSGSYTVLFIHTVNSSATGGRGMLMEELAGPYISTAIGAVDNFTRRFRYIGKAENSEITKNLGNVSYGVSHASVKEMYLNNAAAPLRNVFWSRGIQVSHRSSADLSGTHQQQILHNTPNLLSVRQTGSSLTEYQHLGQGESYITLLKRGPWISDSVLPFDTSENFAPDLDLHPQFFSKQFRTITDSGASVLRDDSTYHDWIAYTTNTPLAVGNQSLTAFESGQQFLLNQIIINDLNGSGNIWNLTSKFEGTGDPISRAAHVAGAGLLAGTPIKVSRGFLITAASTLSDAILSGWRDDLKTPATLTFTTGSLKTNSAGDTNVDGFNERHGWYEVNCVGNGITFTMPISGITRNMPAFRLNSWAGQPSIYLNDVLATNNVDYTLDNLGSGTALLQLLGNYTSNLAISVTSAVPADSTGTGSFSSITLSTLTGTASSTSAPSSTNSTAAGSLAPIVLTELQGYGSVPGEEDTTAKTLALQMSLSLTL